MNFKIGEKVVYINKKPFSQDHFLQLDKIYTVTRVTSCRCGDELIGIAESSDTSGCHCAICSYTFFIRWYRAFMFRRLCTGEILDELLEKNPLTKEVPDITPEKEEKGKREKRKKKKEKQARESL